MSPTVFRYRKLRAVSEVLVGADYNSRGGFGGVEPRETFFYCHLPHFDAAGKVIGCVAEAGIKE